MSIKKDRKIRILAIETSCDETAAAVVRVTCNAKRVTSLDIESNIISSQVELHAKYGGVYPELASREHIRNIIPVIKESYEGLLKVNNSYEKLHNKATIRNHAQPIETIRNQIDYIAATNGPGLIGSLLVGVNTAKTMAYALKKPIYAINHLEGHIYSCFAGNSKFKLQMSNEIQNSNFKSQNENCKMKIENLPEFPILALIVSGGHTSLVIMKDHFKYEVIGETLDDAVGESFDKVAKMLNLGYPGGPAISALAEKAVSHKVISREKNLKLTTNEQSERLELRTFSFPRPMINSKDFNFSFSGIKTSVLYTIQKLKKPISKEIKAIICKEFQEAVVETLVTKTLRAASKYQVKSILLCGGVSANQKLCNDLRLMAYDLRLRFFAPAKNLSTDNAAMIGIAAAYRIALGKKPTPWYDINAVANLEIGDTNFTNK